MITEGFTKKVTFDEISEEVRNKERKEESIAQTQLLKFFAYSLFIFVQKCIQGAVRHPDPFHCGCRREVNWGSRGRDVLDLGRGKYKASSEVFFENREIKHKATRQIVGLLAVFFPT